MAQRFPFEETFEASARTTLDAISERGSIDVAGNTWDRIAVAGFVEVNESGSMTAGATELAQALASDPPVEVEGGTVRLRLPSDPAARRAVTVSWQVTVPTRTDVRAVSDSGAIDVRGVAGPVDARTQSGAIAVSQTDAECAAASESGAIAIRGARQAVRVETDSGAIDVEDIGADLAARSSSGAIDVVMSGPGDARLETVSGAVTVRGAQGALAVATQSANITAHGAPGDDWRVATQSGRVEIAFDRDAKATLDAASRFGKVRVDGAAAVAAPAEGRAAGEINGGGPDVKVRSDSGAIRISVG